MADWPSELPQSPLIENFEDVPRNSVIRTEMSGFTKQRNRYTAVIHDVSEEYFLTKSQFDIFRNFYKNILQNGSLQFIKYDPVEDQDRDYRFTEPYEMEFDGIYYRVSLTLEKLP